MTDERRAIELEIEVPGTPEEVWRAIATGPGITSWYVPHVVEERTGGAATARFGDGPGMEVAGRVAAWEPPHRIVFDGGEGVGGFAFEWLVEARAGGTCVVRLVNSGFGEGEPWDDQFDAMMHGWRRFMLNLRLHLERFAGGSATPFLPMAAWPGGEAEVWARLLATLGLAAPPAVGDRIWLEVPGGPVLAGEVVDVEGRGLALVVDEPAPGTALVGAAAQAPGATGVHVWAYLYGPEGAAAAARDGAAWAAFLAGGAAEG